MPSAVGRYRIDHVLGSGAFASIYLAQDEVLEASVAIKVLSGGLIDDLDVRSRFLEEARILRRADSERLVRVHDIGELPDGRPYFVMSYADKGTLADRMKGRSLPLDEALLYAIEVARGVAVVNRLGIIHRDLKPSNVLFQTTTDGDERLLIADLGLAKALAHSSGAFTLPVGSPGYMSPEQARFGGGLDIRADVYGLGALTYHLLTGRAPTTAPVKVPPSALRAGLSPAIDQAVMRALEVDRERRWPSAEAFAAALSTPTPNPTSFTTPTPPEAAPPKKSTAAPTVVTPLPSNKPPVPEPEPFNRTHVMPRPTLPAQQGAAQQGAAQRPVTQKHRSRRIPIIIATVAVLALLLGGGAAYLLTRSTGSHSKVPNGFDTVTDASGEISVQVPKAWVRQSENTWPSNVPITDRAHAPALRATPNYNSFVTDANPVPGVFIGLTHDRAIQLPPAGLGSHSPACSASAPQNFSHGILSGQITEWACSKNAVTIKEVELHAPGDKYALWVRIKLAPDSLDYTGEILDSIKIKDA
jgi:serine/threonine protein kinase